MLSVRLICIFLTFALCPVFAENASEKPVMLLTGFEPFGGLTKNPSWETVKTFQGREIGGFRVETQLLPVVYDEMEKPLQDAISKFKPQIVICFGVGTSVISIETVARNGYHRARPADNKGLPPPRTEIKPGGEAQIPTKLPVKEIADALKNAKIGVMLSKDAGGYLCNECFYRIMSSKGAPENCGFVHVPDYGKPDPEGGTFDEAKLKRAVEIIATTSAEKAKASK